MAWMFDRHVPSSIPDKIDLIVPAGKLVREIDHSADGAAGVMNLEIGVTNAVNEADHLGFSKIAYPTWGGHQRWTGCFRTGNQDVHFKAWMRSCPTGGSHNLVMWVEDDPAGKVGTPAMLGGGGSFDNSAKLVVTAKAAVKIITLSKGLVVDLNAAAGHDLEIISYQFKSTVDGTVATRIVELDMFDGASGAGNLLMMLVSPTLTAGQTKKFLGGMTFPNVFSPNDGCSLHYQLIVPAGGSLHVVESNVQAADTWSYVIIYRDTPVNLFL